MQLMKTMKILTCLAATWLVCGIIVTPRCRAQGTYSGPSGSWTNTVTDLTNKVWNINSLSETNSRTLLSSNLTTLFLSISKPYYVPQVLYTNEIVYTNGVPYSTNRVAYQTNETILVSGGYYMSQGLIRYPITPVVHRGSGKFYDKDTTTDMYYNWTFPRNTGADTVGPFSATYVVAGSITSSRGITRITRIDSASGTTAFKTVMSTNVNNTNYVARTVRSRRLLQIVRQPGQPGDTNCVISLVQSISVSGWGTFTTKTLKAPLVETNFLRNSQVWTLAMTLSTTNRTVSGTGTVQLSSSETYAYSARGAFKAATGRSIIVLKGLDAAKGSALTVVMNRDAVASIKGRILGQSVNVVY
jgi:hypothetical protein